MLGYVQDRALLCHQTILIDQMARQPRSKTRKKRAVRHAMLSMNNWQELTVIDESMSKPKVIARIPTLDFALIIFILAGILTLYIGQVHRSQDLLDQINTQRRENVRLHLQHNRFVSDLNATIGPSVIHQRAGELGLKGVHELADNSNLKEPLAP